MSNVLIGIIGVILFIGLALAGALYLGNQFNQATYETKASAVSQVLAQTISAVQLSNAEGNPKIASAGNTDELVNGNYMKSRPVNPIVSGNNVWLADASSTVGGDAAFAVMNIGATSNASAICTAIVRRTGQNPNATNPPTGTTFPDIQGGCIKGTGFPLGTNEHYVFAKI